MRSSPRLPLLAALGCVVAFAALLACAYMVGPVERLDATALHGLGRIEGPPPLASRLAAHLADPLPLLACSQGCSPGAGRSGAKARRSPQWRWWRAADVTARSSRSRSPTRASSRRSGRTPTSSGPRRFPAAMRRPRCRSGLAAVLVAPGPVAAAVAASVAAYVLGVCTSVLVLGWHFPSDVLGGLLVASASSSASWLHVRTFATGADGAAAREQDPPGRLAATVARPHWSDRSGSAVARPSARLRPARVRPPAHGGDGDRARDHRGIARGCWPPRR